MTRRILLLITDLEIGGTPTVVRELAIRLNRPPEVVVEVACLTTAGPVAKELIAAGIAVSAFRCTSPFQLPVATWKCVQLIRRGKSAPHATNATGFDTVFSFLVHANTVAAAASPSCKGVRFLQSIQTAQRNPAWHWKVQSIIESAADRIVVPSRSVAEAAQSRSGIAPQKIAIIPNAVNAEAFEVSSAPREDLRPYPIAFIGRLDVVKRIPDLLHAVKLLEGLVKLDVYGTGDQESMIRSLLQQLELTQWVTLHGSIDGPQKALGKAGLLVLPSEAEGFGLVLIEAMAACVPVVATNVPGIRDVVENEVTGLLVKVASPEALASAIRRIVEDRILRERLIGYAHRAVREKYDWESIFQRYRAVLQIH